MGAGKRVRIQVCLTVALSVASLAAATTARAEPEAAGHPNSILALGDSITRAFGTGASPFKSKSVNSWSTGANEAVGSHYARILTVNPEIGNRLENAAKVGADVTDLLEQVQSSTVEEAEYVTILIGANDVCTPRVGAMTPPRVFRDRFQQAMQALAEASPDARVFVASIPNVYRLWKVHKGNAQARLVWRAFRLCQSLLLKPLSKASVAAQRRREVRRRTKALNKQLARVCAEYVHCRFDENAVFRFRFKAKHVSARDFFHLSLLGQKKLAAVTWRATFDFTDVVAPLSVATATAAGGAQRVTLTATDDVDVAGIEYRLDGGAFHRYTEPITLDPGATLTYRAVDVNGNVEATRTFAG